MAARRGVTGYRAESDLDAMGNERTAEAGKAG
jgi:hypothetical protein